MFGSIMMLHFLQEKCLGANGGFRGAMGYCNTKSQTLVPCSCVRLWNINIQDKSNGAGVAPLEISPMHPKCQQWQPFSCKDLFRTGYEPHMM